jgi:hypothetical protein
VQSPNDEPITQKIEEEEDDDFGEFSEVQVAPKAPTVNSFLFRT